MVGTKPRGRRECRRDVSYSATAAATCELLVKRRRWRRRRPSAGVGGPRTHHPEAARLEQTTFNTCVSPGERERERE